MTLKGMTLFYKAYQATQHEIWVSLKLLTFITLVFALAMFIAESNANPDFSFWDAIVWTFVKYVDDPADITDAPITAIGKIVGTMVGILGIAIFAVPAGLIGSGLMDAMADEKHDKELQDYHRRMRKSFRRMANKTLRGYLNTLPDGGQKLPKLNVVPQRIALSRIQLRQGIDMKDIFEICQKYPEFRLKNLAEAISEDQRPADRFVVEHYPTNRPYGCCINRGSHVTIVSTSSAVECGTGWFTYYLAKFGGFNYISKDIEVDPDELDSFYNLSPEPLYDKQPREVFERTKDKEALAMLDKKEKNRSAFLDDLRALAASEEHWTILFTTHIKNNANTFDFHFAASLKDGSDSTIINQQQYEQLRHQFDDIMRSEYELTSDFQSKRYPLTSNNLGYTLRKRGITCNTFVLRPSCDIVNFDHRNLLISFRIAGVLSEMLDNGRGCSHEDIEDLSATGFGYRL